LEPKDEDKPVDDEKERLSSEVICDVKTAQWEKVLFYL
jgi:hypothetical protein